MDEKKNEGEKPKQKWKSIDCELTKKKYIYI